MLFIKTSLIQLEGKLLTKSHQNKISKFENVKKWICKTFLSECDKNKNRTLKQNLPTCLRWGGG